MVIRRTIRRAVRALATHATAWVVVGVVVEVGSGWSTADAQTPAPSTPPPAQPAVQPAAPPASQPPAIVDQLRAEAKALQPLVTTAAVRELLAATASLPTPEPRVVYRDRARGLALAQAEWSKLDADEQSKFQPRTCDARFYYTTGYGSPLIYARPLDLVADKAGWATFAGRKILDFGYGMIGQGRLLASCGAGVTAVDVEPLLHALYSDQSDTGDIDNAQHDRPPGKLMLFHGRWPADENVARAVGDSYDLVISKNVLKAGYIHPAREVDPKFTVQLGVDDATFLNRLHAVLKPGGYAMIYNIAPAQNPPDKPYLPHADGKCPFDRAALASAGFEVLAFDEPDVEAILDVWHALELDDGSPREDVRKSLFAWWTLLRRPTGEPARH